ERLAQRAQLAKAPGAPARGDCSPDGAERGRALVGRQPASQNHRRPRSCLQMGLVERAALEWANAIRREHGLAPVSRLHPGMRNRPGDCSLARTIAPGHAVIEKDRARVFGKEYELPPTVRRFLKRFDWG